MRRSLIVVLALTFTLILTLTGSVVEIHSKRYYGGLSCTAYLTFPTEGRDYYGYGEEEDGIGQMFKVWITVSTWLNQIKVKWEGHLVSYQEPLPTPGQHYITFLEVYDDEGYHEIVVPANGHYGTNLFYGYTGNYTWVHAKVKWWYQALSWEFFVKCVASVHIEE